MSFYFLWFALWNIAGKVFAKAYLIFYLSNFFHRLSISSKKLSSSQPGKPFKLKSSWSIGCMKLVEPAGMNSTLNLKSSNYLTTLLLLFSPDVSHKMMEFSFLMCLLCLKIFFMFFKTCFVTKSALAHFFSALIATKLLCFGILCLLSRFSKNIIRGSLLPSDATPKTTE